MICFIIMLFATGYQEIIKVSTASHTQTSGVYP